MTTGVPRSRAAARANIHAIELDALPASLNRERVQAGAAVPAAEPSAASEVRDGEAAAAQPAASPVHAAAAIEERCGASAMHTTAAEEQPAASVLHATAAADERCDTLVMRAAAAVEAIRAATSAVVMPAAAAFTEPPTSVPSLAAPEDALLAPMATEVVPNGAVIPASNAMGQRAASDTTKAHDLQISVAGEADTDLKGLARDFLVGVPKKRRSQTYKRKTPDTAGSAEAGRAEYSVGATASDVGCDRTVIKIE